jgi:dienelactone hydrolase
MRPVEALALLALSASFISMCMQRGDSGWLRAVAVLGVLLFAGLAGIDRWRWPLLPACVLAALILLAAMVANARPSAPYQVAATVMGGALLLISTLACLALPALPLPPASGSYPVGVTSIQIETLPVAGAPLHLEAPRPAPIVDLWYPAGAPGTTGTPVPWLTRLRNRLGLEDSRHALVDAPLAQSTTRFPVLIYFPGWEGTHIQNFVLIRELASHGFVVAGVHYPARNPQISGQSLEGLMRRLERQMDFSTPAAGEDTLRRADERVRTRAADAIATLDRLVQLDAVDPAGRFTGRIDVQRAGIFGFSLGGAVAAQACWLDSRFKAALNLDGWLFSEAAAQGINQPYFFMTEEGYTWPSTTALHSKDPSVRLQAEYDQLDLSRLAANYRRHGGYYLTIAGTWHMNFSDYALRSRFRRLGDAGPIDPRRATQIVNTYTLAFFQKTLTGMDSPLLSGGDARYSEVRFQSWPARAVAGAAASP